MERPHLELSGLACQAVSEIPRSLPRAAEHSRQAIGLASRHGWTDEQAVGLAYQVLGGVLAWQGRLDGAELWVQRAERTVKPEAEPATGRAEQALADLGEHDRERGEIGVATAVLRLAQDDPHAATATLAPVLDGSAPPGLADLAG
jgi:LuxR family transcriptional regulator, maltose regulon positive regulatory protein